MKLLTSVKELATLRRQWAKQTVALVPTMGNLHEGHLTLVDLAQTVAERTIASIFVNPTQFAPGEDYATYPRSLEQDLAKLEKRGCDGVWLPTESELYPFGLSHFTMVEVPLVGEGLCDARRPGHFRGVTSVVSRLFNAVAPQHAVFGQKDYQQLHTIRRMTTELLFPVTIHAAPIAREASGLALSSRNGYLTETQKQHAGAMYRTLQFLAATVVTDPGHWPELRADGLQRLIAAGLEPEYLELRCAQTLLPAAPTDSAGWVLLVAAVLGKTRLIDNLMVKHGIVGK